MSNVTIGYGLLTVLWMLSAAASPFDAYDAEAQFRDALLIPDQNRLYFAVNNRDEIWVFDPHDQSRIGTIPVGRGPVALALSSDGHILACVNRLDNTVSLIHLPDETLLATVPVGESPATLAAMPDGRFVVTNTFSESVTILDPGPPILTTTLEKAPGFPSGVTTSGRFLGVIGRIEPQLTVIRLDRLAERSQVPLPDIPHHLGALSGDRFVVGCAAKLLIVDPATHRITRAKEIPVEAMTVYRDEIFVLYERTLVRLDATLAERERIPLDFAPTRISVVPGALLAMSPRDREWRFLPLTEAPSAAIAEAPPELPHEPPETTEIETPRKKSFLARLFKRYPLRTAEGYVAKPAAAPTRQIAKRTITDALRQPTEFGSLEAGFEPPDWTEPLRDVEAEKMTRDLQTGVLHLENNVRLRMGNMLFRADSLTHSEDTGEIFVKGNVQVEQESSRLTASEMRYQLPMEEEMTPEAAPEAVSPLTAELDDQERARQRLSVGKLDAKDVHIVEPAREMTASEVHFDFASQTGELTDVRGRAGLYYFHADKLYIRGPQQVYGEEVWVTTCDQENPHYRLRMKTFSADQDQVLRGSHARLQFGKVPTPLYLPRWRANLQEENPWYIDFRSGRSAELGYYANVGMQFEVNRDITVGPRLYPTEKEGVGLGLDVKYDFMDNPASPFFRSKGEAHGLMTTESRGYGEWYHRYEYSEDLVVRGQLEMWRDRDVYKDFHRELYRHRTTPRDFVNVTYRQPSYIATSTARLNMHRWVYETEYLPEATFHLIERRIAPNLYFTYDTLLGYNEREQNGDTGGRQTNIARLSYAWAPVEGFTLTPHWENEATFYLTEDHDDTAQARLSTKLSVTAQSRFHKTYPGFLGFSEFKHMVVPSVTMSYRPKSTLSIEKSPRYDAWDSVYGQARIESKLDNLLYGRDAYTNEVWQVGRFTLYQGNDLWNETSASENYEAEIDLRPRPWWGFQLAAERHKVNRDILPRVPLYQNERFLQAYELIFRQPWRLNPEIEYQTMLGDFNRVLTHLYYDDIPMGGYFNGRAGFIYTETASRVYNRDILYSLGCKLGDHWGLWFEHIVDISRGDLRIQTYEIRRTLHCWETALRIRNRERGTDFNIEFSITAFPGTRIRI